MVNMAQLRLDPQYRALPVEQQLALARTLLYRDLMANDERFRTAGLADKDKLLSRLSLHGVTFEDEAYGARMRQLASDYAAGNRGFEKGVTEFAYGIMQTSGIAGLVSIIGGESRADRADRKRTLEYFRRTDALANKSNPWAAIGSALGFIGDIVAVNTAMGGATKAANAGIQASARGMTTASYIDKADDIARGITAAKDALRVAKGTKDATAVAAAKTALSAARAATPGPILYSKLAAYGPIAAEAAIEAVPYFILEEARRYSNGERSAISQGAGEVLKTLGVNAASDFVIGSALTKLLHVGSHVVSKILKRSDRYADAFTDLESKAALLDRITNGPDDARLLAGLPEIDKDHILMMKRARDYIKEGVANPDIYLEGRAASLANNELARIWGKADDGSYYLYEQGVGTNLRKVTFESFNDLENTLAIEYAQKFRRSVDIDTKAIKAGTPGYKATANIRPDLEGIYKRGELLLDAERRLSPDNIAIVDQDLSAALTASGRSKHPPIKSRPVITLTEANALSAPGVTVVKTKLDLEGSIVSNINERHLNLLKGSPSVTVKASDTPNAVFVGVSEAPDTFYRAALEKANEISKAADAFGVPVTPETALTSIMLDAGFDHVRLPDGSIKFFSTRSAKLLGTPQDILKATSKSEGAGELLRSEVLIKTAIAKSYDASKFPQNPAIVTSAALKAVRSGDPENYLKFAQVYLRAYDSGASVGARRVAGTQLSVTRKGASVTINVPVRFTSPEQEAVAIKRLLNGLDEVGELTAGPKAFKRVVNAAEAADIFATNKAKFGFPSDIDSRPWVKAATKDIGGSFVELPDGTFRIDLPSGQHLFSNLLDAQDFVARKSMDPAYLRKQLLEEGIRVLERDGSVQLRDYKTGRIVGTGTNLEEALNSFNWAPKKISNKFAPTEVLFGTNSFTMVSDESRVFKDWEKASQYLAKFEDQADALKRTTIASTIEGTIYKTGSNVYEVYSPKWDSWQTFDSPSSARNYLRHKVKPLEDLKSMGAKKMLDITIENNRFRVESPDGRILYADDQEALARVYAKFPDLEKSVREVTEFLDPAVTATVGDLVDQWRRSAPLSGMNKYGTPPTFEIEAGNHVPWVMDAFAGISQKTDLVEAVSAVANQPELLRQFRTLQGSFHIAKHESTIALKYLDGIFKDQNGKYLSTESRQKIFYWLGRTNDAVSTKLDDVYKAKFGKALEPLTQAEQKVANDLREFYKRLEVTMGIPFEKIIHEYMPRIRDLRSAKSQGLVNSIMTPKDLLATEWGGKPPASVVAFFEHDRTSDALEYALKDDALEVAMLYANQGFKTFYMNRSWEDMHKFLNANKNVIDPVAVNAINQWREAVMGNARTWGEKNIENFGRKFFTAIKRSPIGKLIPLTEEQMSNMGGNILPSVMGLTYVSSMGWKPFLAIRNTFQTWTLGSRVGLEWIARAQANLLDDYEGTVKSLRALGILKDTPPIVNQVWSNTTKLGKVANASLEWFANSDDYSRALMYKASEMRFRNATDAFMQGKIGDRRTFMKLSGLSRTDSVMQEDLWKMVSSRSSTSIDEATHLFSAKMTSDSMFIYEGPESPELYKGALGKLFGQFGNFSAGFRAQLRRMFSYGDFADKVEMVASYVGVSLALWGTFAAFKIKTNDFIPFAPALFSGGPLFDVSIDVMKLSGGGYEADQARARLKYSLPTLVPGSAQYTYVKKAIEFAEKGDSYRAFLSLTSTPVLPE
jgi:hypothetical protein